MTESELRFFNRELSWLEFNQRVLEEAQNTSLPLLERLKFLAITASNLDEFFMIRVGGLQTLQARGSQVRDSAGMTPEEQLTAISERAHALTRDQHSCYLEQLEPAFAEASIQRLRMGDLTAKQTRFVQRIFNDEIVSLVAPLAVETPESFPTLIGNSISMCVRLERPSKNDEGNETRYVILPFGRISTRFVTLPSEGTYSFVLLEELVEQFIAEFFPRETVLECVAFRATRNADMAIREDLAGDLLQQMKQLLVARRESDFARLEITAEASTEVTDFLKECLGVEERDVYRVTGPLDLTHFFQVADAGTGKGNRYEDWSPLPSPMIDPMESLFETISRQDVMLYHPYDSFSPVVRFVEEAAVDPDVLAIKQTLYRTSRNSPIIAALAKAAENGKHVTVIIELKARFDEARNMEGARALEHAGVQVFYGVKGLKTHAKICIVVRREPQGIQRYVHFGTGNYNESTARLYSDVSLLTCNEDLGADAVSFFNSVTGYSMHQTMHSLSAAPITLRDRLAEMIEAEIQFKHQRQKSGITIKVNSLVDPQIIELLYRASQAGVKVRLNVRGICCLRPGVPGLSENIEVVSVIDRFLEHARILHFRHGGDDRVFISSADWMVRSLDRRVELLVPVEDDRSRQRLMGILECYFKDHIKGRRLKPDGTYEIPTKRRPSGLKMPAQEWLYRETCRVAELAAQFRQSIFEPHRAPDQ
jgi:polyphosphate kinase